MSDILDDTAKDVSTIIENIRAISAASQAKIDDLEDELKATTQRLNNAIKLERTRLKEAAREQLLQFADMTTRLRAVRALFPIREELGINQNMLAFAIFGAPHKSWQLRKLISPPERPCQGCGLPIPCGNRFESHYFKCLACEADDRHRSALKDAEIADRNAREKARAKELASRSGLTDAEIIELANYVWMLTNEPVRL